MRWLKGSGFSGIWVRIIKTAGNSSRQAPGNLISWKQVINEVRLRNLTLIFSVMAIIISMLGIFGMSIFSCERRTKEIGIRKANGASVIDILVMLNTDFLKWVVVSFVISGPLSWYAMHRWLESFAYRTELSWWIFVLAACLVLSMSFIAVNWQAIRVSRRNPVATIRNE